MAGDSGESVTADAGGNRALNGVQEIDSRVLFARSREIVIQHDEMRYRLRLTSNNKLILTK